MNYTNPRMKAEIENWPSGQHRVKAIFEIEQNPKRGERAIRTTTGAPKKLTFAEKARIVDGDDGRTYVLELSRMFGHISIMKGDMKFQHEVIFEGDERYPELVKLFKMENQSHDS